MSKPLAGHELVNYSNPSTLLCYCSYYLHPLAGASTNSATLILYPWLESNQQLTRLKLVVFTISPQGCMGPIPILSSYSVLHKLRWVGVVPGFEPCSLDSQSSTLPIKLEPPYCDLYGQIANQSLLPWEMQYRVLDSNQPKGGYEPSLIPSSLGSW